MRQSVRKRCRAAAAAALLVAAAALPAGSAVVPDRTLLLLQQEITDLTKGPSDAVVYGGSRDADLLRQIAAATRATAQAQVELLRQHNEIIRLLEALGKGPRPAR